MATGFGITTNSKENIIKSLEKSYCVDSQYLWQLRNDWDEEYTNKQSQEFTQEDLFDPREYSYHGANSLRDFKWNPNSENYAYRKQEHVREMIISGYWSLQVLQDLRGRNSKNYQEWNFSISVWRGERFVFHPRQARNNIVRYHGVKVFDEWRKVVLDDLNNFKTVLQAYNPSSSMFSATCCDSSARVCKRLGLDVRKGFAFMVHRKGESCEHKDGTFAEKF